MFRLLKMRPLRCLKTLGTQWCNVTSQKNRNLVISILKMLEFTFNSFFKLFVHCVWFCCDLYITLHSYNTQASSVLKLSSALCYYWDWCTVSSELVFWTFLYRMGMKNWFVICILSIVQFLLILSVCLVTVTWIFFQPEVVFCGFVHSKCSGVNSSICFMILCSTTLYSTVITHQYYIICCPMLLARCLFICAYCTQHKDCVN